MSAGLEIQIIAVIIAVACALPGVFLVLRKMSMICDSITHTILLGIVIAFFITDDLSSPLLIIGAGIMGVLTVWLTEMLVSTRIVTADASVGIVFPLLFSVAIILISKFADNTHLCVDSVLLGELAYAPFDRLILLGVDIGAKSIYTGLILLLVNVILIVLFFKELKLVTFDLSLATAFGFTPAIIHYGVMSMVSVTTVVAFETVGSILVIAFMIGPAITAYLLTDNLKKLIFLSAGFGSLSAVSGYQIARFFDISIAGTMATMVGIIFFLTFIFAPKRGLISVYLRRKKQKKEFEILTLLIHIYKHQGTAKERNGTQTICTHLSWERKRLDKLLKTLENSGKITCKNDIITLTEHGVRSTEMELTSLL